MTTTQTFEIGETATVRIGQTTRTGKVSAVKTTSDGGQLVTVRYRANNGAAKTTTQRSEWISR